MGRRANWASLCPTADLGARSFNAEVCGSALRHFTPRSGHVFSTTMVVDDVAPPRRCVIRRRATYHGVLYENAEKRSIFRNCFTRGLIVKIVLKKGQIAKKTTTCRCRAHARTTHRPRLRRHGVCSLGLATLMAAPRCLPLVGCAALWFRISRREMTEEDRRHLPRRAARHVAVVRALPPPWLPALLR